MYKDFFNFCEVIMKFSLMIFVLLFSSSLCFSSGIVSETLNLEDPISDEGKFFITKSKKIILLIDDTFYLVKELEPISLPVD